MQQIIFTLIFYLFLIGVMVMLYLMWRDGIKRNAVLQEALIEVSNKSAEAALHASEAAQKAVVQVEKKSDS